MLHLTRKADYGLRLMLELGASADGAIATAEIAGRQGIPYEFLRKVGQTLVSRGLLQSERGARGGFTLTRPAEEITLLDMIRAFESPALNRCTVEPSLCDRREVCAAYPVWLKAQQEIERVLGNARLSDLVRQQAAMDRTGRRPSPQRREREREGV